MGGEPTDAGRYILEATNEAGVDSSYIVSGKILCSISHVKLLTMFFTGEPIIVSPPVNQFTINDGSSAVFVCDALADPEHTISWTFTNNTGAVTEIFSDGKKYSIVSDRSTTRFGELTVMNVDYEDRGVYTCTVTNSFGSDRASANLTVHGESSVTSLKCWFSGELTSLLVPHSASPDK